MVTSRRGVPLPFPYIQGFTHEQSEQLYLDFQAVWREGQGTRWRTVVIAASDSHEAGRASADYRCTGTADQGVINQAITDLEAHSSGAKLGRIVLLEGTYNITAAISISTLTARTIAIEGMSGSAESSLTVPGSQIVLTGAAIHALELYGPGGDLGAQVILENLAIKGGTSAALVDSRDMSVVMRQCRVENSGTGTCVTQGSSTGGCVNSTFEANWIANTGGGNGLSVVVGPTRAGYSFVRGNTISVTGNGTAISTGNDLSSVPSYHVTNNVVSGGGTSGSGVGISVNGTSTQGNVVSGNNVQSFGTGISVAGYKNLVLGNRIETVVTGIKDGSFQLDATLILGNNIVNATTTGIRVGNTSSTNNTIMNNKIVAYAVQCVNGIVVGASAIDTGVFFNDSYGAFSGSAVSDSGTNTRREGYFITTVPAHASSHYAAGSDPLTGDLDANARIGVRRASGGSTYKRRRINFIDGAGITTSISDDSSDEEVDVTIASTGAGAIIDVDKNGTLVGSQGVLNFIEGTNVTLTVTDTGSQIDVTIDATGGGGAIDSFSAWRTMT